jgi:hypothetical protein
MLEKTILPYYAASNPPSRVLFVGVARYTREYASGLPRGMFATIDPKPEVARYGGNPHIVDIVQHVGRHFPRGSFDLVLVNGVVGFGLNDVDSVNDALDACHAVLRPGGDLILGINEERRTHVDLKDVRALAKFVPFRFGPIDSDRVTVATPFAERTHTFVFFRSA